MSRLDEIRARLDSTTFYTDVNAEDDIAYLLARCEKFERALNAIQFLMWEKDAPLIEWVRTLQRFASETLYEEDKNDFQKYEMVGAPHRTPLSRPDD